MMEIETRFGQAINHIKIYVYVHHFRVAGFSTLLSPILYIQWLEKAQSPHLFDGSTNIVWASLPSNSANLFYLLEI